MYSSKWYKANISTQKIVSMFIIRSQKHIVVNSGFYEASLETFTAVIKINITYKIIFNVVILFSRLSAMLGHT